MSTVIKKIAIKPKSGKVKVRKPDGQWLSQNGETVKRTAYWLRRIKDGDVIVLDKTGQANSQTHPQVTETASKAKTVKADKESQ